MTITSRIHRSIIIATYTGVATCISGYSYGKKSVYFSTYTSTRRDTLNATRGATFDATSYIAIQAVMKAKEKA